MLNKLIIAEQLETKVITIQMLKTQNFRIAANKVQGSISSLWNSIAAVDYNRNVPTEFEGVGG